MEQYGLVLENKGKTASVHIQRHLACANCGKCGILSGSGRRDVTIDALNPIKAEAGQKVVLESEDRQVIFVSFILYLVPLGALVAGIVLGLRLAEYLGLAAEQELVGVASGFALMIMVFFLIRKWDRLVKDDPKYKPVITALADDLPHKDSDHEGNEILNDNCREESKDEKI